MADSTGEGSIVGSNKTPNYEKQVLSMLDETRTLRDLYENTEISIDTIGLVIRQNLARGNVRKVETIEFWVGKTVGYQITPKGMEYLSTLPDELETHGESS